LKIRVKFILKPLIYVIMENFDLTQNEKKTWSSPILEDLSTGETSGGPNAGSDGLERSS